MSSNSYSTTAYYIEFANNGANLEVRKMESNELEQSFDLAADTYEVRISLSNYLIEKVTPLVGFSVAYNLAANGELNINKDGGVGVTDIRIERNQPSQGNQLLEYTYNLKEVGCPVFLSFVNGLLYAKSPCNPPCSEPLAACVSITTIP